MSKEIIFIIKVMHGGGAERVISLLSHAAAEKGYNVSLLLTHQNKKEAVLHGIDRRINVISLPDEISNKKRLEKSKRFLIHINDFTAHGLGLILIVGHQQHSCISHKA